MSSLTLTNRRLVALAAYAIITSVSFYAAYQLRFEFDLPARHRDVLLGTLPLLVAIRAVGAYVFKLSRGRWRFVSTGDVLRLVLALSTGTLVFYGLTLTPIAVEVPRSVLLMELALNANLTAAVWILYRVGFERLRQVRAPMTRPARRVVIIGAGEAGNMLAREMARMPTGYFPVAFVDDDVAKWGSRLQGLEVLGGTDTLSDLVRDLRADEIAIAVPSAEPPELRRVVARCEETGLPYKVLPGIAEVLAGDVRLTQLRDVRIEDLLGREPVQLDLPELARDMAGKVVLITGAAGSIGSELARQVARHTPDMLVVLDQAETALYYLELELKRAFPDLRLACAICDVVDASGLEAIFAAYRPDRVFHAAAYKHVPMMEANPREAVRNNVIGTSRVAEFAGRFGCERFVLVSTDKAVAPSSIMGATKRLAELLVLELQRYYPDTAYSAVRFGNVLGSNGSVIPIFKKQLKDGQPLTITHPDVTRYFMTIPEAVQLILQSTLLPEVEGRIAMLDMGQPVPIVALAENLLRLSGEAGNLRDRIVFTGLRPGEKLHEELVSPEEQTIRTALPKVRVIATAGPASLSLRAMLPGWEAELDAGEMVTIAGILTQMFPNLRLGMRQSVFAGATVAGPMLRVETLPRSG
jgi:FlaA1/EpsC-like NDP-sugar epimerase